MASFSFTREPSQSSAAEPFLTSGRNAFSREASRGSNNTPAPTDPLQPLRTMADRVGKEVEKFAERVDHWHIHGNGDSKTRYQTTVKMVGKFRDLAESNVKELKKQNDAENQGDLNRSVRRRIQEMAEGKDTTGHTALGQSYQTVLPSTERSATPDSSSLHELRQWQAELATWELLRIIIEHYHPEPGTDIAAEKRSRLAKVGGAMRYSPNSEIWNRFLLEDDEAKEKKIILRWLEQTARNSENDIESITAELETHSGKDTHSWTSGWLDSKSKIKQEKRMQGIDQPLAPDPGVLPSRHGNGFITQLDPDAPYRQQRILERSDEYYERALWMVCYEMMRRGVPWTKISEWFQDRSEAWRGISIGAAFESSPDDGPNVAGETIGFLFRRMALYAARGARTPYEGAVYALLCGDLQRTQAVCRSWDDHLYANYNALLLSRFDNYLKKNHSHRVSQSLADRFVFQDASKSISDWQNSSKQVIAFLRQQKATSAQATSPMKLIQSSLISRTVDELMTKVGIALAEMLQGDNRSGNLMIDPESEPGLPSSKPKKLPRSVSAEKFYWQLAADPHALRILVHVFVILRRGLRMFDMDPHPVWAAMDNVLAAYIEFLRLTKRWQLIPLYAAQLEGVRATHCLSRVLPDIKNAEEQRRCVNLMESYRLDVPEVISTSVTLAFINGEFVQIDSEGFSVISKSIKRFEVLERAHGPDQVLWPGWRISSKFSGLDVGPQEEAIIDSLQWYQHLGKSDGKMFSQLADALLVFLLNGRIGAAEKLIADMSVEALSLLKTEAYCGYSFDFTQPGSEEQDDELLAQFRRQSNSEQATLRPSQIPSAHEHASIVRQFRDWSALYYELQQIVRLIVLFREWREEEDNILKLRDTTKVNTKRIKELSDTIQAIFDTILLPPSQLDQPDLRRLHRAYLPDLIIANLSILQSTAFFVHRDSTIKAMEIANTIADKDNAWLQQVFLDSGMMSPLMDTFARVSRAMLSLTEGGSKKEPKKRGSKGETVRIWDLNAKDRV